VPADLLPDPDLDPRAGTAATAADARDQEIIERRSDGILRPPETIATARLRLRPMGLPDAADMFGYARDAAATRFMNFPRHRAVAESEDFARRCEQCWRDGSAFPWAIVLAATATFIGGIELRIHPPKADFGYVLCPPYWRHGYASEAAASIVMWALAQPQIFRVWATCHPDNVASARVLEKAGLRLEGRLARWEPRPNLGEAAGDSLVYAAVRADRGERQ
jgi:RimJ/RimL family protein N-acetyltransferase